LRMPGRDSNHSATFRSGMEHGRGTFHSSRGCVRDAALGKLLSRTRRPLRQPLHRACHVWARRYQDAGQRRLHSRLGRAGCRSGFRPRGIQAPDPTIDWFVKRASIRCRLRWPMCGYKIITELS
jgi:hypothetical protein